MRLPEKGCLEYVYSLCDQYRKNENAMTPSCV